MDRTRRQRWFKDNVAGPERNGFPCTAWTEGGVFSIEKLSRINRWIGQIPFKELPASALLSQRAQIIPIRKAKKELLAN